MIKIIPIFSVARAPKFCFLVVFRIIALYHLDPFISAQSKARQKAFEFKAPDSPLRKKRQNPRLLQRLLSEAERARRRGGGAGRGLRGRRSRKGLRGRVREGPQERRRQGGGRRSRRKERSGGIRGWGRRRGGSGERRRRAVKGGRSRDSRYIRKRRGMEGGVRCRREGIPGGHETRGGVLREGRRAAVSPRRPWGRRRAALAPRSMGE